MLAQGKPYGFRLCFKQRASTTLVVVLLQQLVAKLNVLGLGILLAQASVDLFLPLVVLRLALYVVSACPCLAACGAF